jgi:hypothetical protein
VPKAGPAGRAESTCSEYSPVAVALARRVVAVLGGRYSAGLGIDVDAREAEVERWFVAATLFGARIPARVAERTFGMLASARITPRHQSSRGSGRQGRAGRPGPAGRTGRDLWPSAKGHDYGGISTPELKVSPGQGGSDTIKG